MDTAPEGERIQLPPVPGRLQKRRVKAWAESVTIPTYSPLPADRNPMFLEKRVYQGSSGRVYPLPFVDRVSLQKRGRRWKAIHLENQYVRVMILPEIGGRIHVGMDKTSGYDFFYRQNVMKPALVGLAGPWVSGGVEFNWPQHHRPATYMPVQTEIEEHEDGSVTVWCSDHDPMNRLKGMHGVCLHPGRSYIELKVRLHNRTPLVQTFLWWANVATHVHEQYQSFFPPDVRYVADHAKRAMSRFPLCDGRYYGVDYGARARSGVPAEERPSRFYPSGAEEANDLGWYANIPVPTSYMALGTKQDFFGGYDHRRQAGLVHVANRHIAPGKKQWTWGNHEFGYAWDRNLTDSDGPYVELMAGVYTENQPDFSFLAPGETKTFSQYWYPIQKIGPASSANREAAVSLRIAGRTARTGVAVTQRRPGVKVELLLRGRRLAQWSGDLAPGTPLVREIKLPARTQESDLALLVRARDGEELIRYSPPKPSEGEVPPAAKEPPPPHAVATNEQLYLIGLHLSQYRHATRYPELYWQEGLRRDAGDARCNHAMGVWHLRRGEFDKARERFEAAIRTLTALNPNPYDGEPYYHLGLTLRYLGEREQAYAALYKSTWNFAWRAPAYHALADIDAASGDWLAAEAHLRISLTHNTGNLKARNLLAVVLRKLGKRDEAARVIEETLAIDPLDAWAGHLAGRRFPGDNAVRLDVALDMAAAGLYDDAIALLRAADMKAGDGTVPMVYYTLGYLHERSGDPRSAKTQYARGASASGDYCFPSRLEEMIILQAAIVANPRDAAARYYLGNLLYDRRRHGEAIALWEESARLRPRCATVWRNLGIAYFNILHSPGKALRAFDRAFAARPADARVLYERDQLWKRCGRSPRQRLAELLKHPTLVEQRDDLTIELCALLHLTGQYERALEVIRHRRFQPWEGGEGQVLGQHVRNHLALGRRRLCEGKAAKARTLFEQALACPENLGEARHLLANQSDVYYWLGVACAACGDGQAAGEFWRKAAEFRGDFQEMQVRSFSEMTYYSAMSLQRLGRRAEANRLLRDLKAYAAELRQTPAKIDYFATSLPAMLLFEDDLQKRQQIAATVMIAQAERGLGRKAASRKLLKDVLQLEPSHALAMDLLSELPQA